MKYLNNFSRHCLTLIEIPDISQVSYLAHFANEKIPCNRMNILAQYPYTLVYN